MFHIYGKKKIWWSKRNIVKHYSLESWRCIYYFSLFKNHKGEWDLCTLHKQNRQWLSVMMLLGCSKCCSPLHCILISYEVKARADIDGLCPGIGSFVSHCIMYDLVDRSSRRSRPEGWLILIVMWKWPRVYPMLGVRMTDIWALQEVWIILAFFYTPYHILNCTEEKINSKLTCCTYHSRAAHCTPGWKVQN